MEPTDTGAVVIYRDRRFRRVGAAIHVEHDDGSPPEPLDPALVPMPVARALGPRPAALGEPAGDDG